MSVCTARKSQMIIYPQPQTQDVHFIILQLHNRVSVLEDMLSKFMYSLNDSDKCLKKAIKNTKTVTKSKNITRNTLKNLKQIVIKCKNPIPDYKLNKKKRRPTKVVVVKKRDHKKKGKMMNKKR